MYQNGELQGPTPIPPLKTATTVPALVLHACPHHDVAEVDHELEVVALGTGTVAKPWETTYIEHEYRAGDSYGVGWYSRYRRDGDNSPMYGPTPGMYCVGNGGNELLILYDV